MKKNKKLSVSSEVVNVTMETLFIYPRNLCVFLACAAFATTLGFVLIFLGIVLIPVIILSMVGILGLLIGLGVAEKLRDDSLNGKKSK